jgi:hypothetical protein
MKQFKVYQELVIALLFLWSAAIHGQAVDLVANVDVTPPLNTGQTFTYSIMSTGNSYNALRIKLVYDPGVIQLNSLSPVYAFDFTPVNNTSTPGLIQYEASSLSGNITTDETLFTIEFEVLSSNQAISIAHNYDTADGTVVVNSGGNDVLGTANDILLETLSIDSYAIDTAITIYPNPSNTHVIVKAIDSDVSIQSVAVITLQGKTILFSDQVNSGEITINTSSLANALYFLRIETKNGHNKVAKLLVSH